MVDRRRGIDGRVLGLNILLKSSHSGYGAQGGFKAGPGFNQLEEEHVGLEDDVNSDADLAALRGALESDGESYD